MVNLYQKTWAEINMELAKRIVQLRKRKKISQKEFAVRSGVSLGSLKRFEQTGEISLQSFTKLAIALGVEGELEALFEEVPFDSIEEILHDRLNKLDVYYHDRKVGTMALYQNRLAAFAYSDEWLQEGFSISPFSLPFGSGNS